METVRARILAAIARSYRALGDAPEDQWSSIHELLKAHLRVEGLDLDTMPDTCAARADTLDVLAYQYLTGIIA